MFSTTTIASSITKPIAAATPPSVIRSNLTARSRYIARNVTRIVTGMKGSATNVVADVAQEGVKDDDGKNKAD